MYKPGKEMVAELTKQLGPHMQWTEAEQLTLSFIEHAADRRIPLAARFDALVADPDTPPSHLAAISGELRLTDNMIHRWMPAWTRTPIRPSRCVTCTPRTSVGIRTVARSTLGADATTRAYLLGQAREFAHLMCSTLLEDGAESAQFASHALSPRVDALARGDAVWLRRFELPPMHVLRAPGAGRPNDLLELDSDDVIREV